MKRSSSLTWAAFAAFSLATALGLSWVTSVLLDFEREKREREASERMHADLRLAAWRVDTMLAPILAEEAARPASHFRPFSPLNNSLDSGGESNVSGGVLVPSPILNGSGKWTTLNFQFDSRGTVTSPQVPQGAHAKWARNFGLSDESAAENGARLKDFSSSVRLADLSRMLDEALSAPDPPESSAKPLANAPVFAGAGPPGRDFGQGVDDYNARSRAYDRMTTQQSSTNTRIWNDGETVSRPVPMWISGGSGAPVLILARRVQAGRDRFVQGAVLDWDAIRSGAEAEIRDLFPGATLAPRLPGSPADPNSALAVLPLEIDPGRIRPVDDPLLTPLRIGIGALWAAFAAGFAFLLAGIASLLALNRRRLDFVSAVTHELRTPLTTFRMYAEMLEDGMVPPGKTAEYYSVLREESLRLTHLVQNVLDYSRLESNRSKSRIESAGMEFHLGRIVPALRDRCDRAGVPFRWAGAARPDLEVRLDSSAVGQILLNLADNACKYGRSWVSLSVDVCGGSAEFAVSDGGEPIDYADRARIFEPFVRGRSSEGKGPGVGLGLALCRRWARAMNGELEYRPGPPHAFVLRIPA